MFDIKKLTSHTKSLAILAIGLIIYGHLCRIAGLYFFWESKTLGWTILLIAIISFLLDSIKSKKAQDRKVLSEMIFIGLILFILFTEGLLFFAIPKTNAYAAAEGFINSNMEIKKEIGEINSIFLIPVGAIQIVNSSQGQTGQADLYIIVKGSKKYRDMNLHLLKNIETNWVTEIVN